MCVCERERYSWQLWKKHITQYVMVTSFFIKPIKDNSGLVQLVPYFICNDNIVLTKVKDTLDSREVN